jgi:molybdopterin converting factor small subunit
MNISLRLGGDLVQSVGVARLTLHVPDHFTVDDLVREVAERYPNAASQLGLALPIVAGRLVSRTRQLEADQEVSFLLPIAGG